MPLCPQCGGEITCPDHAHTVDGIAQDCPLKKGIIWTEVTDYDGNHVNSIQIEASGVTKETADGFACFDPMDSGNYPVKIKTPIPETNDLDKSHILPDMVEKDVTVIDGKISIVRYKLIKLGKIVVGVCDEEGNDIENMELEIAGETLNTQYTGLAESDYLTAGSHKVTLKTLPEAFKNTHILPDEFERDVEVNNGDFIRSDFGLVKMGDIKVKIFDYLDGLLAGAIPIQIANKTEQETVDGLVTSIPMTAGEHTVKILNLPNIFSDFILPEVTEKTVTVTNGNTTEVEFKLEKPNIITPKIEAEYKLILLDHNHAQYQTDEPENDRRYASATRIELSLEQTNVNQHRLVNDAIQLDGIDKVDVFTDKECKNPLTGNLTVAQLTDSNPLELWLRGKTAGKFTLSLSNVVSTESRVLKLSTTAHEIELGVVDMQIKLYHYIAADFNDAAYEVDSDVAVVGGVNYHTRFLDDYHTRLQNLALPATQEVSNEVKTRKLDGLDKKLGLVLHEQREVAGIKCHGRTKVIIQQLMGQFPADIDTYKIKLIEEANSGSIKIYDAEFDGNEINFSTTPLTVANLKTDSKTYWVEGEQATDENCGLCLTLELDRDGGEVGLTTTKEAKINADWAKFTIVKVDNVEVDINELANTAVNTAPQVWNETNERFYINLRRHNPTDDEVDSRKLTIGAQLSEAIEGITVHFMLVPNRNNATVPNWGVDIPDTWHWDTIDVTVKHLDKQGLNRANRNKLLHITAQTDVIGYAKAELILSRFGGDIFHPACYIDQDPYLAKYVDGHIQLGNKQPVIAAKQIQIWRKVWYQTISVQGMNVGAPDFTGVNGAETKYANFKVELVNDRNVEIPRLDVTNFAGPAIYPRSMITGTEPLNMPNNTEILVVTSVNSSEFFNHGNIPAWTNEKPVMVTIIVCHAQWDADGFSASINHDIWSAHFPRMIDNVGNIVRHPIHGNTLTLFESGDWQSAIKTASGGWDIPSHEQGALNDGFLTINANRQWIDEFNISRPPISNLVVGSNYGCTKVKIIDLVVRVAENFLGEYRNETIVAVFDPTDIPDFHNTIVHEIGHGLFQTKENIPAVNIVGIPAHPHQYDDSGSHCNFPHGLAPPPNPIGNAQGTCVMYDKPTEHLTPLNTFCPACHPYLLIQDMSLLVWEEDGFNPITGVSVVGADPTPAR